MGTLLPKNWKKFSFLLVSVPFLRIESSVIPPLKAFYQGLHFFVLLWWAMNNTWAHYDLEAWKFDDLTVLCAVWFTLSVLKDLFLKPWADQHLLTFKVNVKVKLEFIILFFRTERLESRISKTASHSATKLNSYVDPYPTMCSACFGVDPDYRSGSRAKSGFSDFPHYLRNLPSDLQMQYL